MKVIIIAAGSATRLGKLTEKKPKGLLEINGKSILQRQIDLFKKYDIQDIIIITGPHKKFGLPDISYINDKKSTYRIINKANTIANSKYSSSSKFLFKLVKTCLCKPPASTAGLLASFTLKIPFTKESILVNIKFVSNNSEPASSKKSKICSR